MRKLICAAVLLAAIPASAQSIPCQVTIARAPDDVRQVVEGWVKSEAQCSISLEVRIVPTEGGYYLLAEDERGRVRERIVPDAQTAGVLVASWIADDNAPADSLPPPPPAPVVAPATTSLGESVSPPGLAPVSLTATAPAAPARRSHWLTLGALLPIVDAAGSGLRAEADVWRRGAWTVGAGASLAQSQMTLWSSQGTGDLTARDVKGIVYLARASQLGRWQIRPAVGAGLMHSDGLAFDGATAFYTVEGWFPTAEGSVMISRELGKQWAAYASPLATIIAQEFTSTQVGASTPYPMTIQRSYMDFALFAGVRHRL